MQKGNSTERFVFFRTNVRLTFPFCRVVTYNGNYDNLTRVLVSCDNACVVVPSSCRNDSLFLDALAPFESNTSSVANPSSRARSATPSSRSQAPESERRSAQTPQPTVATLPAASPASGSSCPSVSHPPSAASRTQSDIRSTPSQLHNPAVHHHHHHSQAADSFVFYIPNADFALPKAKAMCALLLVKGMPDTLTPDQRVAYLSHVFSDDVSFTRALGALLSFVVQNGIISHTLDRRDDTIHLDRIFYRDFCDVMHVPFSTLWALHVFNDEVHPLGRGGLKGKEALSLYGILKARVKTASARRLLRTWLCFPSSDVEQIKERQAVVSTFLSDSNRALLISLRTALTNVGSVQTAISNIRRVSATVADWKRLYSSTRAFVSIIEALRAAFTQRQQLTVSKLLRDTLNVSTAKLREVVGWIDSVVDFEESSLTGKLIIVPGFSEEIDSLKRTYSALDDYLTTVGEEVLQAMQEANDCPPIQTIKMAYEPSIGFLVVLCDEDVDSVGLDAWTDFGLTYLYHVEGSGYHFRSERTHKLDDDIGDIHCVILDLESKAARYLETKVLPLCEHVLSTSDQICELDCLQGLAQCAHENGWNLPVISDDSLELVIENGRHPLLSLNTPSFVPNSTAMKFGDVHVVTGANFSGKSVYIHQVTLLVILAQVGSAVPADCMQFSVIKNINGQLRSFESVGYGHSSFFEESSQVSPMFEQRRRCLNLMDEFGKGTSEVDGNAILIATLRKLWERGLENESVTLCTTHFISMLKEPFLPVNDRRFVLFSMEVIPRGDEGTSRIARNVQSVREKNAELDDVIDDSLGATGPGISIVRTFRIVKGMVCSESWSLQVALEAQVHKHLLRRVADVQAAVQTEGIIPDVVMHPEGNERFQRMIEDVQRFLHSPTLTQDDST